MMLEDLAARAHQQIVSNGGVTINLQGAEPTQGYAFSPYPELERVLPASGITPDVVLQYLQDNEEALAMPGNHLGAWHDVQSGNVFLDISHVGPPTKDTIQEAKKAGQIALFDLATGQEIPTGLTRDVSVTSAWHMPSYDAWERMPEKPEVCPNCKHGELHDIWSNGQVALQCPLCNYVLGSDGPDIYDHPQYVGRPAPWGAMFTPNYGSWANPFKTSSQDVLTQNMGRPLQGLPDKPVNVPGHGPLQFGSHRDIQRVADEYNRMNGLGAHPTDYVKVNPQHAQAVAQEYEAMPHNPNDPTVKAAYDALAKEVRAQYDHAVRNGYQFEFYPDHDPYPNSPREAVLDLHHNKHMYVYPTDTGYGAGQETWDLSDHPLLADSGVRWGDRPVTHNDLFRAIHDFYGHAKEGVGFRHDGEDNAYRQHAAMFSPLAQRALASETRGQNSWVNFGPHAEHNQTATHDTIYAPQKAGLMPEWTSHPDLHRQTVSAWDNPFKQSDYLTPWSDPDDWDRAKLTANDDSHSYTREGSTRLNSPILLSDGWHFAQAVQPPLPGQRCHFHPDRPAVASGGFAGMCQSCLTQYQHSILNTTPDMRTVDLERVGSSTSGEDSAGEWENLAQSRGEAVHPTANLPQQTNPSGARTQEQAPGARTYSEPLVELTQSLGLDRWESEGGSLRDSHSAHTYSEWQSNVFTHTQGEGGQNAQHVLTGVSRPSFKEFLTSGSIRESKESAPDRANVFSTIQGFDHEELAENFQKIDAHSGTVCGCVAPCKVDGSAGHYHRHPWGDWFRSPNGTNKVAAEAPATGLWHVAPTTERARILQHGLQVSNPHANPRWEYQLAELNQPHGIYATDNLKDAQAWKNWDWMPPMPPDSDDWNEEQWGEWEDQNSEPPEDYSNHWDTWHIPAEQIKHVTKDENARNAWIIHHPVFPNLHEPVEQDWTWPHEETVPQAQINYQKNQIKPYMDIGRPTNRIKLPLGPFGSHIDGTDEWDSLRVSEVIDHGDEWPFDYNEGDAYYHLAPTTERARIQTHGLQATNPLISSPFLKGLGGLGPPGVYLGKDPEDVRELTAFSDKWNRPYDIWQVHPQGKVHLDPDYNTGRHFYTPESIHPQHLTLHEPWENNKIDNREGWDELEFGYHSDRGDAMMDAHEEMRQMDRNRNEWMIGRPTPKVRHAWKIAKETPGQTARRWGELLEQYPDQTREVHRTPEGYSIRILPTFGDIARTGLHMRNCWQGLASYSDPSREVDPFHIHQRHTLHDEKGHPQVAFFLKRPQFNGDVFKVDEPLGPRNRAPKPEYEQALKNWANEMGFQYNEANYENPMLHAAWRIKEAKETPNQELKRWQELHELHPNTAKVDHQFSNGWTVQQLQTRHDVNRVGKFMQNCWQGKAVLYPKKLDDSSNYWTLNDERGLPRAAFKNNTDAPKYGQDSLPGYPFMKHNPLDKENPTVYPALEIDQALGMRNQRLNADHAELFRQWATTKAMPIHFAWSGGAAHFDHPQVQQAYFSGKGHIFDGGSPIQGILGEPVPA